MSKHQKILKQFDQLFRSALKANDKPWMKSLVEGFREVWENIPLAERHATYLANSEAWEETITYLVTHPGVEEPEKVTLTRLLEETTPVPI